MRPKSRVSWMVVAGSAIAWLVGWAPCSAEYAMFDFRVLRDADYDPLRTGAQIRIVDRSAPETPILDLTSTAAIPGGSGCGSRDGWRRLRNGFAYRNTTDALPPDCIPGSAGGLTRVRLKDKAHVRLNSEPRFSGLAYEVDLASGWRPAPGARIATTIVLGDPPTLRRTGPCLTLEVRCAAKGSRVRCE